MSVVNGILPCACSPHARRRLQTPNGVIATCRDFDGASRFDPVEGGTNAQ